MPRRLQREPDAPRATAEEVAKGVRAEVVGSKHQDQGSDAGGHDDGHDIGATAYCQVCHEPDRQEEGEQKSCDMRRRSKGESQGEQDNARAPFPRRTLQGMSNPHRGIKRGEKSKGSENLVVGVGARMNDGWTKAVQGHRDEAASITVEAARYPPQRTSQENSREQETAVQQQQHVPQFVAHLPGGGVGVLAGKDALQSQRQPGDPIGQRAIGQVSAGGKVSRQGIWLFPHLTATTSEVIVARGKRLAMKSPQALEQQQQQQQGCELLRALELEA